MKLEGAELIKLELDKSTTTVQLTSPSTRLKLPSVNSYFAHCGIWRESGINPVGFPMARAEDAGNYSLITNTYLIE